MKLVKKVCDRCGKEIDGKVDDLMRSLGWDFNSFPSDPLFFPDLCDECDIKWRNLVVRQERERKIFLGKPVAPTNFNE